MKFDSIEYLQRWGGENKFPAIHDAIYDAISVVSEGRSYCDLGSCTGLLAQRIATGILGSKVCGVEANEEFTRRGNAFGIHIPTLPLRVSRSTLGPLAEFLERHAVTVLVARRVMPELWGHDLAGGRLFSSMLQTVGVREIFLEGRVVTANAVNPLSSLAEEVKLFEAEYIPSFLSSAICHLCVK